MNRKQPKEQQNILNNKFSWFHWYHVLILDYECVHFMVLFLAFFEPIVYAGFGSIFGSWNVRDVSSCSGCRGFPP